MSTHKRIDIICIVAILIAIALTGLLMWGKAFGIVAAANEEADSGLFTANDLNGEWNTSSATKILLSDKGSTVIGNGAYVYNGDIYIIYSGRYVLSGEFTEGNVIIDAENNDKIWLCLDGVKIHCDDDAAIRVEQAGKVFLTMAEGTENTLSSGAKYNADVAASGVDGAVYSRDDLTINGAGALAVNAEFSHGIVCNDNLVIAGGDITISAVQDGIHANDSVCIRDAVLTISAGDDGITVSNDDETAFLYVESGCITIPTCYEGLEAVDITIGGGTIDIMCEDDGINASGKGRNSAIRIKGGNIAITNPSGRDADGLDSNGSIYIEGGRVLISVSGSGSNSALDYGSENGGECVISGGTVIACGGSTMAEGFDASSPQGFYMCNQTGTAGTQIRLEDSQGRELLSEVIPCSFSSVVLSTPELKVGDVCTIEIGGVQEQVTIDNSSSSGFWQTGMFGGGMHGGRGHEWMNGGEPGDRTDGMSGGEEGRMPGGRGDGMPDGMPGGSPEGMPNGMPDGMPDGEEGIVPDGMPGGKEGGWPGSMGGGKESGMPDEMPGGTESFGRKDAADSEKWSGRQVIWETGGRAIVPELGKVALVGISVLSLLIGLFVAIKIKH